MAALLFGFEHVVLFAITLFRGMIPYILLDS